MFLIRAFYKNWFIFCWNEMLHCKQRSLSKFETDCGWKFQTSTIYGLKIIIINRPFRNKHLHLECKVLTTNPMVWRSFHSSRAHVCIRYEHGYLSQDIFCPAISTTYNKSCLSQQMLLNNKIESNQLLFKKT